MARKRLLFQLSDSTAQAMKTHRGPTPWLFLVTGFTLTLFQPRAWADQAAAHGAGQVVVGEPATLVVWNRPIVVFRAGLGRLTPEKRAETAAQRIEGIPDQALLGKVWADPGRIGDLEGYLIGVDNFLLFGLVPQDLDPVEGRTLEEVAKQAAERVREVLQARADQRRLPLLMRGIGLSLAALVSLVLVLWLTGWLRRRLLHWLETSPAHLSRLVILEIDLRPHALALERRILGVISWVIWIGGFYLCLTFIFSQFPYTQPWGKALGGYLVNTVATLASGAIGALPGLGTVLIIFLLTRLITRLVGTLFSRVETEAITVSWMLPETARATRRAVVVMIWLFALTVAYPHIPGSGTDAFKGVSVLVGLMISLGSAGLVNQVMSGFVVLYSRAIRTGDYVRIGDIEGTVTELGVLSAKVVNRRKEEINIPNAVLVGTTTTNYSRLADHDGAIVPTSVTIGYDVPWRQVHALLLLAAERTPGVRKQPRPRVLQQALSDFYVEYVLLVHVDRPDERILILSALHAQIQDAFNEFGVQIMSPHFMRQPATAVTVPPAKWHEPPAKADEALQPVPVGGNGPSTRPVPDAE
jgi:small-conductance mechanosensitive channel